MKNLLLTFLLLMLANAAPAAWIEGRVVNDGEPHAGVVVGAWTTLDFNVPAVALAAPTADDGSFRLELPQGDYALFGWSADRSLFAFCGRNPVPLAGENVWAGLQVVAVDAPVTAAYDDPYSAAVEGRVLHQGQPLAGAYVSLYLDVADDLKGQGYRLSQPTGADGYFRFDGLPESSYFLVARARRSGERVGPVQEGDLFGVFSGNPLTAIAGSVQQVVLHAVAKQKDAAGSETFGRATGPVLRGTIVDHAGKGVAGIHVFAYVDRVIGHQRPAAISTPTGADGQFTVNLPAAGTYYVGAREAYGDSPAPGELFGMYEGSADHGMLLAEGETREGVRILVEPVSLD